MYTIEAVMILTVMTEWNSYDKLLLLSVEWNSMMTMDSAGLDPVGQQGGSRWYDHHGGHGGHQVHDHDHDPMGASPYFSAYHHAYPAMNHGN